MCARMYVRICVCMYLCVYVYVCMYVYMHVWCSVRTHEYVYIGLYLFTCKYISICMTYVYVRVCIYMCPCMSLLISIHVYITYVHVYMSLCVYVCLQNYKCYNSTHFRSSPSRSIGPLQNLVLRIQGTFTTEDKEWGAWNPAGIWMFVCLYVLSAEATCSLVAVALQKVPGSSPAWEQAVSWSEKLWDRASISARVFPSNSTQFIITSR